MAALVIVDGHNVIGARPDGWWRDRPAAARRLVQELAAWAVRADREVLVVFDGRPSDTLAALPRVEVRFAASSRRDAADDVIAALVEAAPDARALCVVTSDAALVQRVRACGAQVLGSGAFRRQLERG